MSGPLIEHADTTSALTASETPHADLSEFIQDRGPIPAAEPDRTPWFALTILASLLVCQRIGLIDLDARPDPQREQRLGQLEKSQTVVVDLVEAPSEHAEAKPSQLGIKAAPQPPSPNDPPQQAQTEQPPAEQSNAGRAQPEPLTEPPSKPLQPSEHALSVDDFDVSMAQYMPTAEASERSPKSDQKRARNAGSPERAEEFGAAPVGKQSTYTKATLAMLSRTKPDLFTSRGKVHVAFELDRTGKLKRIVLVTSSGDALLDATIFDWLKQTKYEMPPPGATRDELIYDIYFTVR